MTTLISQHVKDKHIVPSIGMKFLSVEISFYYILSVDISVIKP